MSLLLLLGVDDDTPPDDTPPEPTIPSVGAPEVTCELRTQGAEVLARFRAPSPGTVTSVRHAVGDHSVSWVPADEPGVLDVLAAPTEPGGLHTWRSADIELWVLRDGALVQRGPVTGHTLDPAAGVVTTWAKDCVAYLWRLDQGRGGRTNLLPDGDFDGTFTGWTEHGDAGVTAVTSGDGLYMDGEVTMRLAGDSGAYMEATSDVLEPVPWPGLAHIFVPIRWEALAVATDAEDLPVVATVIHQTADEGSGAWATSSVLTDVFVGDVQASEARAGVWYTATEALYRTAGKRNRWKVRIDAQATRLVGRVRLHQGENVSARAGLDPAMFVAALFDRIIDRCLPGWWRHVAVTGEHLAADWISYDHDHPAIPSVLGDIEPWGDWWVSTPNNDYPGLRFAPRASRGRATELRLTPETTSDLRVEIDAYDASSEALRLADGQNGPTREEGSWSEDPIPGALLMSTEMAPEGTAARDLEHLARTYVEGEGQVRVAWTGQPADGPAKGLVRDLPGAWVHKVRVGDTLLAGAEVGPLSAAGTLRVLRWTWDPLVDSFSVEPEAVP